MHIIERIALEGVNNTRDLGGFRTRDGHTVRYRRLLRSGALAGLSESDKEILLGEYQLRRIVDFRTETERNQAPDPFLAGAEVTEAPVLGELTLGITREQSGKEGPESIFLPMKESGITAEAYMQSIYDSLIRTKQCREQYAVFFDVLVNAGDGATLWHCSAGKDRAGVGTALLLSALGVPREDVTADYLKTGEFIEDEFSGLLQNMGLRQENPEMEAVIKQFFGVRESYITAVFDIVDKEFGAMDQFLADEMKLTDEKRSRLREKYLTD